MNFIFPPPVDFPLHVPIGKCLKCKKIRLRWISLCVSLWQVIEFRTNPPAVDVPFVFPYGNCPHATFSASSGLRLCVSLWKVILFPFPPPADLP